MRLAQEALNAARVKLALLHPAYVQAAVLLVVVRQRVNAPLDRTLGRPLDRLGRRARLAAIRVGEGLEQPLRSHRLWAPLALGQRGCGPLRFRLRLLNRLVLRRLSRFRGGQQLLQARDRHLRRSACRVGRLIGAAAAATRIALPARCGGSCG